MLAAAGAESKRAIRRSVDQWQDDGLGKTAGWPKLLAGWPWLLRNPWGPKAMEAYLHRASVRFHRHCLRANGITQLIASVTSDLVLVCKQDILQDQETDVDHDRQTVAVFNQGLFHLPNLLLWIHKVYTSKGCPAERSLIHFALPSRYVGLPMWEA